MLMRVVYQSINMFQLAAANLALIGGTTKDSTVDPTINTLLSQIRTSTSQGSVKNISDPNYQQFNFIIPECNSASSNCAL